MGMEKGSENARFHEIYLYYYPRLCQIARQWNIPCDEIEDVIQDSYLSYYEHYPPTWPEDRIGRMLTAIFRNRCIDYWRKAKTSGEVCMDPKAVQFYHHRNYASREKDNLMILIQRERYEQVMDALREMKEEWLAVFVLYIIEDRPIREVSERLGISEALCRMRLMRGRKYLRNKTGFKEGSL